MGRQRRNSFNSQFTEAKHFLQEVSTWRQWQEKELPFNVQKPQSGPALIVGGQLP